MYRKYANDKSFFKIVSPEKFEEKQVVGRKVFHHIIEAKIYPDKLRIQDMIENTNNQWLESSEEEYNNVI